ncbi:MAG: hypothetical protein CM1200mP18_18450 [Gammaproteobacteria bacterium]|nr:MAG: hypothetical protein CM1200mP18_18450 [Gammaproteobacteria bacterium]
MVLLSPPFSFSQYLEFLGGIGADPENVTHMRRIADKLFGDQYIWSILAGGRHQLPLVTMGAVMGSNVRVGLEDSLYMPAKGDWRRRMRNKFLLSEGFSSDSHLRLHHLMRPEKC